MNKEIQRFYLFNELSSQSSTSLITRLIMCSHTNPSNFKKDPVFPNRFSEKLFNSIQTKANEFDNELKTRLRLTLKEGLNILTKMNDDNTGIQIVHRIQGYDIVLALNDVHSVQFNKRTYNRIYKIWKRINPRANEVAFHSQLWQAGYRYKYLGMFSGMSASIPTKILNEIMSLVPDTIECFASFFNHTTKGYYGLFYDIEKCFGCKGNLFSVTKPHKMMICNPVFEKCIINCFVSYMLKLLKKYEFRTLIVLPVFAVEDRRKLNNVCHKYNDHIPYKIDYKTDVHYGILNTNPNVKYSGLFCKKSFVYVDMFYNRETCYTSTFVSYLNTCTDTKQIDKVLEYINGKTFPIRDIELK